MQEIYVLLEHVAFLGGEGLVLAADDLAEPLDCQIRIHNWHYASTGGWTMAVHGCKKVVQSIFAIAITEPAVVLIQRGHWK